MYDLVILNVKVFNGNDEVSKKLNIGITNDKIMTITELPIEGKKIINVHNENQTGIELLHVHRSTFCTPVKWRLFHGHGSLIYHKRNTNNDHHDMQKLIYVISHMIYFQ